MNCNMSLISYHLYNSDNVFIIFNIMALVCSLVTRNFSTSLEQFQPDARSDSTNNVLV